jgi:hypothetical protein
MIGVRRFLNVSTILLSSLNRAWSFTYSCVPLSKAENEVQSLLVGEAFQRLFSDGEDNGSKLVIASTTFSAA